MPISYGILILRYLANFSAASRIICLQISDLIIICGFTTAKYAGPQGKRNYVFGLQSLKSHLWEMGIYEVSKIN